MPPTGYKSLTIREKLYKDVEAEADKEEKSVSAKASELLQKALDVVEVEVQ